MQCKNVVDLNNVTTSNTTVERFPFAQIPTKVANTYQHQTLQLFENLPEKKVTCSNVTCKGKNE